MKNTKELKSKVGLFIGIINLLISLFFIKNDFEFFLFFFIIFAICFIYYRKNVLIIIGKPIIKEICKLHNIKVRLKKEIKELELSYGKISSSISNKQEDIAAINRYKEILNELTLKEKQLNIEIIKLEDKKQTIEQMIKQEEVISRAIEGEERTFKILSEENSKLENKKEELFKEINLLRGKINPTKKQIEFINKCNLNYIDNLDGFEFEKFCTELLIINGYENVQNTPKSIDYGIDIIAERDNIKYAIQCKRYKGKVGNEAVQEAVTGKEYYGCNLAIVLTNSLFTQNAQVLSRSAGVILWDRNILKNMIERNKERILK